MSFSNNINIISFPSPFILMAVPGPGKGTGSGGKGAGSAGEEPSGPNKKKEKSDDYKEDESATVEGSGKIEMTVPLGVCTMALGLIFDLVNLIPGVGSADDIIAVCVLGAIFLLIGKIKLKLVIGFIIAAILEFIPIVEDIVPIISLIGILFGIGIPVSWVGFVFFALNSGGKND